MKYKNFIDAMATEANISPYKARKALDAFIKEFNKAMTSGRHNMRIKELGVFALEAKGGEGVIRTNPQTGERIQVREYIRVKIHALERGPRRDG